MNQTDMEKEPNNRSFAQNIGLDEIVRLTNTIGIEYAEAKAELEKLELMRPVKKAEIAIRLDDGSLSEVKLKRLTESDPTYTEFINILCDAKAKAEKLRVRYDSYKSLFEAKRSMMSYHKAEMKLI